MGIQSFIPWFSRIGPVQMPKSYRRSVEWLPQIGDIFPNFTVETTQGPINFWEWAEGSWIHLFSHPLAFTPVCTKELVDFAANWEAWGNKGVKMLALSGSPLEDQSDWHDEIENDYGVDIDFPVGFDQNQRLAQSFGMMHRKVSGDVPIRKSFIIGPDLKIRVMFEYPFSICRNTTEILRVVAALQEDEMSDFATPSAAEASMETFERTDRVRATGKKEYKKIKVVSPPLI